MLRHRDFDIQEQAAEIIQIAESSPEKEVCGVILADGVVIRMHNKSKDSHAFQFGDEYEKWRGETACIWHSHVGIESASELSEMDIQNAYEQGLPYVVYHPFHRGWDAFDPRALHPFPMDMSCTNPMSIEYYMQWRFVYGRSDCYKLVIAYYAGMLGIELGDYDRIPLDDNPSQFTEDRFKEQGFTRVPIDRIQTHDLLCFDIHGGTRNHIGIMCSPADNQFLHNQGEGHVSTVDDLDQSWRDRLRYAFRHKEVF